MKDAEIAKRGFLSALAAAFYVVLVVSIMSNAQRLFGEKPGIYGAVVFLLLFVVSAAVMASLIFGKPVMLYIDGKKREAVMLASYTIAFLAAVTALLIVVTAVIHA